MSSNMVTVDQRGAILIITLDRPEVRNAINGESARALSAALDALDTDPSLSIAILTGAGGWFSAGADLKAIAATGDSGARTERGPMGMCRHLPNKPIIAAVEGAAVGGGFEMVLACDLVVAARDARMGLPEVRRNLVAMGGGLMRLARRLPSNIAAEIALSGNLFAAPFLHDHGLINRLTEPGEALNQAIEWANALIESGPAALAATTAILRAAPVWDQNEGWDLQRTLAAPALEGLDRTEGARAFVEKRHP